ncbi:hypothetical protein [Streptomyces sp. DASNCL29]|uniref:hypothetical protein n=1 Tax=Streptomyces sp. DASNCL29 TaxID=2583819 RepID=UPI00110F8E5A|nr:hypothetical protein [Streptomyces sp. DASNCL29]TMU99551.1 hypothetical protein FGK60_18755 [Streptomyces sp. DASNCL29]
MAGVGFGECFVDGFYGVAGGLPGQVGVDVGGGGNGGVPQVVQGDDGDFGLGRESLEVVQERLRSQWLTVGPAEHQAGEQIVGLRCSRGGWSLVLEGDCDAWGEVVGDVVAVADQMVGLRVRALVSSQVVR